MSLAEAPLRFLMRSAAHPLLDGPARPATAWQMIMWWEFRRVLFNVVVGLAGVIACGMAFACATLSVRLFQDPLQLWDPIGAVFTVIAYGIVANIFYTGGWIVELIVRRAWPDTGPSFARISYTLGTAFAIAVTLVIPVASLLMMMAMAYLTAH